MNDELKGRRVKLSDHDKEAVTRLYAEANKAIEELAQIIAKTLGVTLSEKQEFRLIPRHRSRAAESVEPVEPMVEHIEFEGAEVCGGGGICYCADFDTHEVRLC